MKVLIFGGTGAMGMPLVQMLAAQGMEVHVTSRKPRNSTHENIRYICGNAHDITFVDSILKNGYDVLIDFMVYQNQEFKARVHRLLGAVRQYIFLSSCRVYAETVTPITEDTPRLLDVCKDEEYLKTEEYALAKAREENILFASQEKNWTIVRPSITYNEQRLQLGCDEIQNWLYRALKGKPIVFYQCLADKKTAMTYGGDVAYAISLLVGNPAALGQAIQIASPETASWNDILNIYLEVLESRGIHSHVHILKNAETVADVLGRKWQLKYCRNYNREFDSAKIETICGCKIQYKPIAEGLQDCLRAFLDSGVMPAAQAHYEAYMDSLTDTRSSLSEFASWKSKAIYCIGRYTPYFDVVRMLPWRK